MVRDLGHTPLFQVMFVLEDSPSDVRRFAGLEASRLNVGTGTSVFDLTLEMAQKTDGSLDAVFEYSTDLFAADTIARMAGHLQALLRQIVASPEASVSELSILSPGEQALELADSRSPREAYPQEASLHRLIEAQASKTPDAVALQCDRGERHARLPRRARPARLRRRPGLPLLARCGAPYANLVANEKPAPSMARVSNASSFNQL